jgi:hypothetical protein
VADLEKSRISGGEQSLHADFRGGMEKVTAGRYGIDVGFWGWRRNEKGGIHFEIPPG